MNWLIITIVGILAIVLIVFLINRNQKDEKEFEKELKNEYPRSGDQEGNIEFDEKKTRFIRDHKKY